ncbi:hypothetical protein BDZ94DRAFT_1313210 [Collybia nuda]|uniref:BTB domain-containing protein n=1 Tax=Collybia nuda TaxID=64659 RepID=A0A9P5XVJ9_9AGAR|nr:hypothetical protein BDZ94DRAFT_1313210 [Collybia nuda]
MSNDQPLPPLQRSLLFNASSADVIFKSNDNVLFNVHRNNLEATTGAFPPSDFSAKGQIVLLSEPSQTLDLMFQYIYPIPQPNISLLSFDNLSSLAEAVEKYQVFPAMFICKIHMQNSHAVRFLRFISEHGQEVLGYATRHGYADLVGEVAHVLLDMPLEEALSKLPSNLVIPWALYYSAWDKVLRLARSFPSNTAFSRNRMESIFTSESRQGPEDVQALFNVMKKLDDIQSLRNLDVIFQSPSATPHLRQNLDR